MRDRLIEILKRFCTDDCKITHQCGYCDFGDLTVCPSAVADHLLANGVIVPLCKEGDKVYKLMPKCTVTIEWCPHNGGYGTARCDKEPCEAYVKEICFSLEDIKHMGKTVFLTKELAEKALVERSWK